MISYEKYYQGSFLYNLRKFFHKVKVHLYFIWLYIKVDLTHDRKWFITPYKNKMQLLELYATKQFLKGNETCYDQIMKNMNEKSIKTLEMVDSFLGFEDFSEYYDNILYEERVKIYIKNNK